MEKYTRLQLKMWTGRYWYNTYLRCWGNKKTKKMNQILTILLRNVRSCSNRLSVVVKEVKQGNRFSQPWPPPLMLPGRLDPGKDEEWWQESVLISFWSRSMKSICTTTMRGGRQGGSERVVPGRDGQLGREPHDNPKTNNLPFPHVRVIHNMYVDQACMPWRCCCCCR